MINDITTATATHTLVPPTDEELERYSLVDADKLVMLAFSNLQTAARVYKRDGLTQPQMLERLSLLGIKTSLRTIKRVFADLRAAQDPNFKPVGSSRATHYRKQAQAANRKNCGTQSKVSKGQIGLMRQPVDSSSSKTSSSSQQSREYSNTLESKQVLQQKHGSEPVSRTLLILQSDVDTDGEEQEATVSIMATPEQQQIDADWRDACEHLAALEQFTHKYFDPAQGLSERRYEELWTRCDGIAYFAHMRFANQRKEDERCARQITKLVIGDEITDELEERA